MNEQKNTSIYKYIILVIAFILVFAIGIYFGIMSTMDNPKDLPAKAGVPTASSSEEHWKALKIADDKIIASCGENFGIVSEIFDAQAKADLATVNAKTIQLNDGAEVATRLAQDRNAALKNLGY